MKKFLLLLCFVYFNITIWGQNSVPNGNFETWKSGSFNYPQNYLYTSNVSSFIDQSVFNLTRTTDSYHGTYAVQLATTTLPGDTAFAYFVNLNPTGSSPVTWHGGMAYNQKPVGIRGYYKYNVATADSGTMIIAFSNGGTNIGTYFFKIGGVQNNYTLFNFTFNPPLVTTPDSVGFGAISCKFDAVMNQPRGVAGSVLKLDSISFTGVSSQPVLMNGDFESWQTRNVIFPTQWYPLGGNDQGSGISQTADA
jgi:hypothetical protein